MRLLTLSIPIGGLSKLHMSLNMHLTQGIFPVRIWVLHVVRYLEFLGNNFQPFPTHLNPLGNKSITFYHHLPFQKTFSEFAFPPVVAGTKNPFQEQVLQSIRRTLRPELLNRLDDIVVFQPLTGQILRQVVDAARLTKGWMAPGRIIGFEDVETKYTACIYIIYLICI